VDSATEVRYGGVVVGRSPLLRDRTDAGAFVVFGEPLPVGTTLLLKIDDKEQHARVTEVVESADASAAGMRVRFVSAAEKAAAPARAAAPAAAPTPAAAPAPQPRSEPAAPEPAPAAAGSAPVPTPIGAEGSAGATGSIGVPSSGDASAQHPADPHAHHDGEHGRRKRRRK
jgi:2-oxoglutarate dehydrogenase E2 component (dihydrolipoamide succinyltransferase)